MDTLFFNYVNQAFDYIHQTARVLAFCLLAYALVSRWFPSLLFVALKEKQNKLHAVLYPLLWAALFGVIGFHNEPPQFVPSTAEWIYNVCYLSVILALAFGCNKYSKWLGTPRKKIMLEQPNDTVIIDV